MIDRVTAPGWASRHRQLTQWYYDAFGQRQIATLFTQLNQYHLVLETLPEFQKDPMKLNKST